MIHFTPGSIYIIYGSYSLNLCHPPYPLCPQVHLLLIDVSAKAKLELKCFCPQHPCLPAASTLLASDSAHHQVLQGLLALTFKHLSPEFPIIVDQDWWAWCWGQSLETLSQRVLPSMTSLNLSPSFPPPISLEKQILLLVSCRIVPPILQETLRLLTSCTKYLVNKRSSLLGEILLHKIFSLTHPSVYQVLWKPWRSISLPLGSRKFQRVIFEQWLCLLTFSS